MLKRLGIYTLLMLLFITSAAYAQAAAGEMTLIEKTGLVEKFLYGSEQTGSVVDRANKVEKDLFGLDSKDALVSKVDKAYTYTMDNTPAGASMLLRLNGVEWTLTRSVSLQPAKSRIEALELLLNGNAASGPMEQRLSKLSKLSLPDGRFETAASTVPKDTLVKIKLLTGLDTKSSRPGDVVTYQAVDDVFANGYLVIPKGAQGTGKVTKVERAKNFGRDAKIEINFENIGAADGSLIPTVLGDKAKEETKSLAKAAGATVAGLVILGPIGVVGGAFVQGQDVTIPVGSEMFIQTSADTEAYGFKTK